MTLPFREIPKKSAEIVHTLVYFVQECEED
jgi:hypothetical protein